MHTVASKDGTPIAYETRGDGPALICVTGALTDRASCAPLATLLAPRFTAITYDRRARGDSGDTAPYAVEREIEDLDAVIAAVGGSASVFGFSSGAILALMAARGAAIAQLALYEPAFPVEGGDWAPTDLPERLTALIEAGQPGDAVAFWLSTTGVPPHAIAQIRLAPYWPKLETMADEHGFAHINVVVDEHLTLRRMQPMEAARVLSERVSPGDG